MRLYKNINGEWFGTQADAKHDGYDWWHVEVPVDKAGLLNFLNGGDADDTPVAECAGSVEEEPVSGRAVMDTVLGGEAAMRNQQAAFNVTAEEQIQNGSFDDACRLLEQCTGRINEHIRAVKS